MATARKAPAAKKAGKAPAKKVAAKKPAKAPKKHGRPSKFTPELAKEICDRLSKAEPLAVICRDEHMPCDDTVRAWQEKDEDFSRAIARAREMGWDLLAAECLTIADDGRNDFRFVQKGEVEVPELDSEHIQRSKLRIETRLKLLAKWDPKRYGEKLALGGAADLPPINTIQTLLGQLGRSALPVATDKAKD